MAAAEEIILWTVCADIDLKHGRDLQRSRTQTARYVATERVRMVSICSQQELTIAISNPKPNPRQRRNTWSKAETEGTISKNARWSR